METRRVSTRRRRKKTCPPGLGEALWPLGASISLKERGLAQWPWREILKGSSDSRLLTIFHTFSMVFGVLGGISEPFSIVPRLHLDAGDAGHDVRGAHVCLPRFGGARLFESSSL